jgi:hypothetical protein
VIISSFKDLLSAAREQQEPQRLLFMFAKAEFPAGKSLAQKPTNENQHGGELRAVMCVDKLPEELSDFEHLVAESKHTGKDWDVVFVTSMSGQGGLVPNSDAASRPLDMMVESLRNGNIGNYLAFNQAGEFLQFS